MIAMSAERLRQVIELLEAASFSSPMRDEESQQALEWRAEDLIEELKGQHP